MAASRAKQASTAKACKQLKGAPRRADKLRLYGLPCYICRTGPAMGIARRNLDLPCSAVDNLEACCNPDNRGMRAHGAGVYWAHCGRVFRHGIAKGRFVNQPFVPQRYNTNDRQIRKFEDKLDPRLLVAFHPDAGSSTCVFRTPYNLADLLGLTTKIMMGEIKMAIEGQHEAFGVFWRWATDADLLGRVPGSDAYRAVDDRLLAFFDSDDSDD